MPQLQLGAQEPLPFGVVDVLGGAVVVAVSYTHLTAIVTGSGTTYNVAVSGMTGSGTVIASVAANVAEDGAGNDNEASTSTDNTVTCLLYTSRCV